MASLRTGRCSSSVRREFARHGGKIGWLAFAGVLKGGGGLLGVRGTLDGEGRPLVDGHPWNSAEALAAVRQVAGDDAELTEYHGPERFDILPLLVATDGAVAAFGRDVRRLRPNIIIGGVEG